MLTQDYLAKLQQWYQTEECSCPLHLLAIAHEELLDSEDREKCAALTLSVRATKCGLLLALLDSMAVWTVVP